MTANSQIVDDIKTFLEANDSCSKKEFLAACGVAFSEYKGKGKNVEVKGKAPRKALSTKAKKEDDAEEKPKKDLTEYQKFVKEHMPILKAREDKKADGEEKKKASELMKEIGGMWQEAKVAKKD